MPRTLLLLVPLIVACDGGFWGEADRIYFNHDLDYTAGGYLEYWDRGPIATGTDLRFTASGWRDADGAHIRAAPGVTPTVSGDALSATTLGTDLLEATAVAPGIATVTWDGPVADFFDVEVRDADQVVLMDPAVRGAQVAQVDSEAGIVAGELPDLDVDPILLTEGRTIALWPRLKAEGDWLAFDAEDLSVEGGILAENTLTLSEAGAVVIRHEGTEVGAYTVELVSDGAVASAALVAAELGEYQGYLDIDLVVMAVAWDAEGRRILQPTVSLPTPEGFAPVDPLTELDLAAIYPRTDVFFFNWVSDEAATLDIPLEATVGGVSATLTAPWSYTVSAPDDDTPDPPVTEEEGCCFSISSSAGLVLLFGVLRRRRVSDRPRA